MEKAGFIYTVAGKGCFVAARNTELLREENLRRMEERMEEIRRLALSCGMNREETIKMFESSGRGNLNAIEIKALEKNYPGFDLKLDLALPQGSIMGLIGENGAGKTTAIKLILGMTKPDGGRIEVLGRPVDKNFARVREEIGVVWMSPPFPTALRLAGG